MTRGVRAGIGVVVLLAVAGCGAEEPEARASAPPAVDLAAAVERTLEDGPVHYLVQSSVGGVDGSGDFDLDTGVEQSDHNIAGFDDETNEQTSVAKLLRRTVDDVAYFSAGPGSNDCWVRLPDDQRADQSVVASLLQDVRPGTEAPDGSAVPATVSLDLLLSALFAGLSVDGAAAGTTRPVVADVVAGLRVESTVRVVDGAVATLVAQTSGVAEDAELLGVDIGEASGGWLTDAADLESLGAITVTLRPASDPLVVEAPAPSERVESGCDPGDVG